MEILLEILDILDLLCPACVCRLGISKLPQRIHYNKELDIIIGRLKVRGRGLRKIYEVWRGVYENY